MGVFPGPRRVQQYNPLSAPLTPFSGAGIVPSGGGEGVQLYWFPSPGAADPCPQRSARTLRGPVKPPAPTFL